MRMGDIQKLMKQMKTQEMKDIKQVKLIREDGSYLVINNPQVVKMQVMGQTSFQIVGEEQPGFSEEDIKTVMEQANVSREKAIKALEKSGDLAGAIISLKQA